MTAREAHFLEETFIVFESDVNALLDVIGDLWAKERHFLTEADGRGLLDDSKAKVQVQFGALKKEKRGESDENDSVDVEKYFKPLFAVVELLIFSSDTDISEEMKNGLVRANEDFAYDDRSWLHVACALGKLTTVNAFILRCGCDPSEYNTDLEYRTPLFVAAAAGHHRIVRVLLENGADPRISDGRNMRPLDVAMQSEHMIVVKLLNSVLNRILDARYEVYVSLELFIRDLIDFVAILGNAPRLLTKEQQELLDKLENTDSAVKEIVGDILDSEFALKCLEPLFLAVTHLSALKVGNIPENDGSIARGLTTRQSNFTYKSRSWFHVVCAHGNVDSVKTMIFSCGCNPQADVMDDNGWTPLFVAAAEGHIQIVALLLRYGAIPAESTPIHGFDEAHAPTFVSLLNAFERNSLNVDDVPDEKERLLSNGTIIKAHQEGGTDTGCVVVKHLGKGNFGHVYQVFDTNELCYEAVKVCRFVRWNGNRWIALTNEERVYRFRLATEEVEKMLTLCNNGLHPNLVGLHGFYFLRNVSSEEDGAFEDNLYIFFDYTQGGMTLDAFLQQKKPPIEVTAKLMLDVARGLLFITQKGYIHADLKPENVLVDVPTMLAKISDFGVGYTPAFASPETVRGEVDPTQHQWTWATTTLSALGYGICSWHSAEGAMQFLTEQAAANGLHRLMLDLCRRCMQLNPADRCSMEYVVKSLEKILSLEPLSGELMELDKMEAWQIHSEVGRIFMIELTQEQADYERAKRHFEVACEIAADVKGRKSDLFATSLTNVALLWSAQGQYLKAKSLLQESLSILKENNGHDHTQTITVKAWTAEILLKQGDYAAALKIQHEVLVSRERVQGKNHPDVATALNNLAEALRMQGKHNEAKLNFRRAIRLGEKVLGHSHPHLACWLNNLARLLSYEGDYKEARKLHERALEIDERVHGLNHPDVATTMNNLAEVHRAEGDYKQAKAFYEHALDIFEKVLGLRHPLVATALNNLARLLYAQGKYDEAEPLYQRALEIYEKTYDPNHPHIATAVNNLAELLKAKGNYAEAKSLHERSLKIRKEALGPGHPDVIHSLKHLAGLLVVQGKIDEAISEYSTAISICKDPALLLTLEESLRKLKEDQARAAKRTIPKNNAQSRLKRVKIQPEITDEHATALYDTVLYGNDKDKADIRRLRLLLEKIMDMRKDVSMALPLSDHEDVIVPSPLTITCALGKLEMTKKLVHSGFLLSQADANGHTPFHYAAAFDNVDVMKELWDNHRDKFEWIAFRAKDTSGNDAVGVREGVFNGTVRMVFSVDLVAKYRDGGLIADKLELEQKKNETITFLTEYCKFGKADLQESKVFEDCGEQNTPTRETAMAKEY